MHLNSLSYAGYEIRYKLLTKMPVILHGLEANITKNNKVLYIPATQIKGVARNYVHRRNLLGSDFDMGFVQLVFGGTEKKGNMYFTDAVCPDSRDITLNIHNSVRLNRDTSKGELHSFTSIPAGTEFIGKVLFSEKPNGLHRSKALSTICELGKIGGNLASGFGDIEIQIFGRSRTVVFISYSWEDEEHMKWVYNFAKELIDNEIDVILDQLSTSFILDSPQNEVNEWMTQCVNNCDKVIAILSPQYKYKAENNIGGVGFEYSRLLNEFGVISDKINRYIGVIRKGATEISVPKYLEKQPIFQFYGTGNINESFSSLVSEIKS